MIIRFQESFSFFNAMISFPCSSLFLCYISSYDSWESLCVGGINSELCRVWNVTDFISLSKPCCNLVILSVFSYSVIIIIVCLQVVRAKERLDEELSIQTQQQSKQSQQNTETWSMKWCSPFLSSPHPL